MRDRLHEMSLVLFFHFLALAQSLRFSVATVPSLSIDPSPPPAGAAIPSLRLSGNLTLPPLPAATTLGNTSNVLFPPKYLIPDTDPLIILQINPTRHHPLDSLKLNYLVVRGLDCLVQEIIKSRGDSPIPQHGLLFSSDNAAVVVRSQIPGTGVLTHGIVASLLRGIWEIAALFRPCELDMEVYIGSQDARHYRGHLALYFIADSTETA